MLTELMRPVAIAMCLLSLGVVFNAAFLHPATSLEQRAWDCLLLLCLAAGVSWSGGMIFRDGGKEPVLPTLPVQVFCWGVGVIVLLFAASWFLETHGIFYRDLRRM